MPSTYTAADFLREFSSVYKGLDIRVASIRYEKQWVLVAVSARFRIVPPDTAKQEFETLGDRFGRLNSPAFRIIQQCLPIVEAQRFFELLNRGELVVQDLRIGLSNSQDVLAHAGHPRLDYQRPDRWPSIEVRREINNKNDGVTQALLNNPVVLRDAELAGYEYPYVAVKTLLDIDYSQSSPAGLLWIECDMPVRLLDPVVGRHGHELQLVLRAESHIAIRDVACTLRQTRGGAQVIRQSVIQLVRSHDEGDEVVSWTGAVRMAIQQEDQVTLEALSSQVGRLYAIRIKPLELLPLQHANPLLTALEVFCSAEQIRLLLEEPLKAQVEVLTKKNQARLFEVSVQWLLSALGCRAVWLHSYEKVKEGNVELGTVDCVAYSEEENMLVLVNCSLAAPDPSELHRQENLTTWLRKQFFPDSGIAVHAALFTAAHRPETEQNQPYGSAVRVFFKEDLAELLDAARAGRKLEHLTFVPRPAAWT